MPSKDSRQLRLGTVQESSSAGQPPLRQKLKEVFLVPLQYGNVEATCNQECFPNLEMLHRYPQRFWITPTIQNLSWIDTRIKSIPIFWALCNNVHASMNGGWVLWSIILPNILQLGINQPISHQLWGHKRKSFEASFGGETTHFGPSAICVFFNILLFVFRFLQYVLIFNIILAQRAYMWFSDQKPQALPLEALSDRLETVEKAWKIGAWSGWKYTKKTEMAGHGWTIQI